MYDTRNETAPAGQQNTTIYLKDYLPPEFQIEATELQFELLSGHTRVTANLTIKKVADTNDLQLQGEQLSIVRIELDGSELAAGQGYDYSDNQLTVYQVPDQFVLSSVVEIEPEKNTQLSGLYQSSGNYCTQCEAEGFRRITFFADRPDVLSVYTVTIEADQEQYPVLLSNGNQVSSEALPGGRQRVVWHDPHPKPCYLFALVAGKLERVTDQFVTASGNTVELNVYAEPHNIDKCDHALRSLIKSMQWDEQVYGCEYDLDIYNIVAVDDFNMGAMENKGLNIFNSKYVLALPETATDSDFDNIESVIGHEYFHNWSGNRVTCRDWFQLSLKEGFTVFRDQEFSADMGSRGVKRIQDVNILRTHQFKEDDGPMAHPVRPQSYEEINNFYTVTVYNKGAEVVRMLHTLVGAEDFRRGTDLYFSRHDGQAVTTDDFVQALTEASGRDLRQFKRWYDQAGTPELTLQESFSDGVYKLTVRQYCSATPGQLNKLPFHIPLRLALLDEDGQQLLPDTVVELTEEEQTFEFALERQPVLSFLRGFSAPVKVVKDWSDTELDCLVKHDDDPFVRWEAMQQRLLAMLLDSYKNDVELDQLPTSLTSIFTALLQAPMGDLAMQAELLSLPSLSYLADFCHPIEPQKLQSVYQRLEWLLAKEFERQWTELFLSVQSEQYELSPVAAGQRQLKNVCLRYLLRLGKSEYQQLAVRQYKAADNMTDALAALSQLTNNDYPQATELLQHFYDRWQANALVVDKWFTLQASAAVDGVFDNVKRLLEHPAFSLTNPNKVRSLLGAFAHNLAAFHRADGEPYQFYADQIIALDAINPQVAARLVGVFNQWRVFEPVCADAMHAQLQRLAAHQTLSKDVREIVSKALS